MVCVSKRSERRRYGTRVGFASGKLSAVADRALIERPCVRFETLPPQLAAAFRR